MKLSWSRRYVVAISLVLLFFTRELKAQFSYVTNNGSITITGLSGAVTNGIITVPSTISGLPVRSIGVSAFQNNYTLRSLILPDSIINIGRSAFASCQGITNISFGTNLAKIDGSAFEYCINLKNVILPNSVTNVGDNHIFWGCSSLTNIEVGSLNAFFSTLDGVLFDKTQSVLIKYPAGIPKSHYSIPSNVVGVSFQAFAQCSYLTNVTLPNSVVSIGVEAFHYCQNLFSIQLGTNLANLESAAFSYCSNLRSLSLPQSLTNIGVYYVFDWCSSLTNISVDEQNPMFSSLNGVLFDKNRLTLLRYPPGKSQSSFTCPDGVTTIAFVGLADSLNLSSLTLSDTVVVIGSRAFEMCMNLTNIYLGQNLRAVEPYAFEWCNNLMSLTLPNTLTNIGDGAFYYCSALEKLVIPATVTSFGFAPFIYCYSLTGVYFKGEPPSNGGQPVFYASDLAKVYYLPSASGWGSSFGGHGTTLWLPEIDTSVANFGVRSNHFGFGIDWAASQSVIVEACTNSLNLQWSPIATNLLAQDSTYFSDPFWTNYPARFYRLRLP